MIVEHWFDTLSRPHSRRTTLRVAAVAGAALMFPALRTPRAAALDTAEPCLEPCMNAAARRWDATKNGICKVRGGVPSFSGLFQFPSPTPMLIFLLGSIEGANCFSSAEVRWHRDTRACDQECGSSGNSPGGADEPKPKPEVCDPAQQIKCGEGCCNNLYVCCQCKNGGKFICCTDSEHCEPDPNRNRGSCCT